jgi:putative FmdB family regulatory protein
MPIYEYYCTRCGHEEELLQPMNAKPPTCKICIELKEHATIKYLMQRKLSSIAPPIFKGSGFYSTDYKKKGFSKPDKKVAKSKGKKNGNK